MRTIRPQNDFLRQVFTWMIAGLLLSAIAAYASASVPSIRAIVTTTVGFWGIIIAELILVLVLSFAIKKLPPAAATVLFILYSMLSGLTVGVILLQYSVASAGFAFIIAASMFAAAAVFGYTTDKDLSTMGLVLLMALVGIIVASIVNVFVASSGLAMIVNYLAVLIFTGLTAYDLQRLKEMERELAKHELHNAAILGALALYLNFINLFLSLLNITGDRE